MNTDDYNEDEALKQYFWRAYPDIARPHACLPSREWIHSHLPNELQEEFSSYTSECDAIYERDAAWERTHREETGEVWEVTPAFPELNPRLAEVVAPLVRDFETHKVKELIATNRERIVILRCRQCGRILKTPKAKQCFWCGYNWHIETAANTE